MADVLAEILAHKREEVAQAQTERPLVALQQDPIYAMPRRNFYGAVAVPRGRGPNLIAEVKQASPSAGLIRPDFDPVAIAQQYAAAGAAALSVLTDERYFRGQLAYIERIKAEVPLPVLRKDFIIDAYQVHESRAAGADAVLVIVDAVPIGEVAQLVRLARQLQLWVLLEIHTREQLFLVLDNLRDQLSDGVLLGINNRDLKAQKIDLETTERLARLAPPRVPIVAESGIRTRADVQRMHEAGACALLIGETLLRHPDPQEKISELFG